VTTTRPSRPLLIARRGAAAVAPEHTIPAYEAAIAMGADVLALDLQLSADDQLVVIGQPTLERTTSGRGAVREHTARELKRLDAGGWFGRRFRGQRLQTLSEVLERFRDRVGFAVVLPGGSDFFPAIEERLITLLQIYAVSEATLIASADHHALRKCRDLDPEARTVAVVAGRLLDPARLAPPGLLQGIGLPVGLTTAADVAAARAAGLDCYVGVVDEPAAARELAAWGVAGLVTDHPDRLRPVLASAPKESSG
jgi:glycerophosphoryl diester phosphodiesterase